MNYFHKNVEFNEIALLNLINVSKEEHKPCNRIIGITMCHHGYRMRWPLGTAGPLPKPRVKLIHWNIHSFLKGHKRDLLHSAVHL